MGYELWTSQTTGHRRTGTRISEIRKLFESDISAAVIFEPVMSCPAEAPAEEMREQLKTHEFDVAGVKRHANGELIGFVRQSDLEAGTVEEHLCRLEECHLIADSTPLADTIRILSEKEFQFVLVGATVQGIVVTADLNKPPVRIFLFGLVSLLEMHMSFWIRSIYDERAWQDSLGDQRLQAAIKQFEERKARNSEITLLSCLQFCDKRDLFLGSEEIRERLGIGNRKAANRMLTKAENLRNHLAHSQDDLAAEVSWAEIAATTEEIEQLLRNSDEIVERDANLSSPNTKGALWG